MLIEKWLTTFGRYVMLMGRTFSRPERLRMFFKQYVKEMAQLGVDSIGIVLLISFFIGDLYPDETQYPEPLDAPLGERLHHPRDHAPRVLQFHHVSDPGW